jgi:arsenite-transporting ATPase
VSEIMDEWIKASERIADFLKNPKQTEFIVVTYPDGMVVNHTQRLIETLHKYEINVHSMIINRVVKRADSEFLARMKEGQRPYLRRLLEYRDGMRIVAMPVSAVEIKGIDRLRQLNWMFSS